MALYGYARVSPRDQNLTRQLDALSAFGVEPARVYADKASVATFEKWRDEKRREQAERPAALSD